MPDFCEVPCLEGEQKTFEFRPNLIRDGRRRQFGLTSVSGAGADPDCGPTAVVGDYSMCLMQLCSPLRTQVSGRAVCDNASRAKVRHRKQSLGNGGS